MANPAQQELMAVIATKGYGVLMLEVEGALHGIAMKGDTRLEVQVEGCGESAEMELLERIIDQIEQSDHDELESPKQ